jgi:fucose permease
VLLGTSLAFAGSAIFGIAATVAMPLYATEVLGGDVGAYSLLVSATWVGGIPGLVIGRAVGERIGAGKALIGGMVLAGLLQAGLALAQQLPAAFALVALSGFVSGSAGAWANTLRMANMDASMRGRAFGAMRAITGTPAPFAAILAAVVVPAVGIPATFLLAGLNAIAMGLGLALVREIREG